MKRVGYSLEVAMTLSCLSKKQILSGPLIFLLVLVFISSGKLFSQVITAGHAGKLVSGSAPYLDLPYSAFVSGNFAFVVGNGSNTLEIVDITNPAAPVHKSDYALPGLPQCVFVSGNYVYVGIFGTGGAIEIINITDPANPTHEGGIVDGAGGAALGNPSFVYVSGNFAYVSSFSSNALEILDVSNPALPVHKGKLMDGGGSAPYLANAFNVFVSGNYAYVVGDQSNSLEIVDVSNPAAPAHKGSLINGQGGAVIDSPNSAYILGNYAYVVNAGFVSGTPSLEIIDISNPSAPSHTGNLKDGGGVAPFISGFYQEAWSVFVKGNYAYIVSGVYNALEIVDVTNPSAPKHFSSLTDGTGGANLKTPYSVFLVGNYAYVASYNSSALEIIDVANPANPVHESSLLNGTGGALLSFPNSVFVSGNYAYVASFGSNALEIVDVSNPNNPVQIGHLADGGGVAPYLFGPTYVVVVGRYAYISSVGGDSGYSGALEIVDISNPASPIHVGSILNGSNNGTALLAGPNSIYVSGGYAYVASEASGALEIINVTNPANPVHAAFVQNGAGGAPPHLIAPTSVFVSNNLAYVASAISNSLEIIDVSNPLLPVHKGSIANGIGGALLKSPQSVYVSGNYAFVASGGSHALEIIDVTNPTNPKHATAVLDGGGSAPYLASPRSVFINGNYAYVTTVTTVSAIGNTGNGLEILDITNPTSPVHQSFIADQTGGAALNFAANVYVAGNYAYVASTYSNALEIIYLYSPIITSFSPATGAAGTSVSLTGYNFTTLLTATFNGTLATIAGPVTLTNTTITVPAGSTIGKISVAQNGGALQSANSFIVIPTIAQATLAQENNFSATWSDVGAAGYFLDVSTDNFKTFVGSYNNYSVGKFTSINITGLQPATDYQFRVRSFDGTTMSGNSNVIKVLTLPSTPKANQAMRITQNSFTANWTSVPRASGYFLDVALDSSFSQLAQGYNNLNIKGVSDTTQSVSGLSPYTSYYYRVRAYDSAGTSSSSATIPVFTPDKQAPVIVPSSTNLTTITFGNSPTFAVNISDNVRVDTARVYYKGISRKSFTRLDLSSPDAGGNYSFTVQSSWLDSLGLEYYFMGIDEAGNKAVSPTTYAQVNYPSLILPPLPFGDAQNDYRILAFPYALSTENLTALYLAVPWTDDTKAAIWWWDPSSGGSGQYSKLGSPSSSSSLVAGNGYWVLARNSVTPQLTNVTAPNYNKSNLYAMTLKPNWNEIGNPYPVPISWNNVRAFNPTGNFSALTIFNGNGYETTDALPPFVGGFVKNNGSTDITIQIPFPDQTTIGGRMTSSSSDVSGDSWNISLHIDQDGAVNHLGGFGMNPQATSGPDRYDNFNPPRFLNVPEVNFFNPEYPGAVFSNDIVKAQEDYSWQFTPSGSIGKQTHLNWNPVVPTNPSKQLFLLDEELVKVIDMTSVSSYNFVLSQASHFRIFYGSDVAAKVTSMTVLASAPYPNPLTNDCHAAINLALPESSDEYTIGFQFFNSQGELINTSNRALSSGIHTLEFSLTGDSLAAGMYIYKLSVASHANVSVFSGKIVKP